MSRTIQSYVLAIVLAGWFSILTPSAFAAPFVLMDENSTATIDPEVAGGMLAWTVDGVGHVGRQWFWYRVGASGPESSISTLTLDVAGATDTDADTDDDTLFIRYLGTGFQIEITYSLLGGSGGSGVANIAETIEMTNTGGAPLEFHFFQYSDFDMDGTSAGDSVALLDSDQWVHYDSVSSNATVVLPTPSFHEAAISPTTLNSLKDGNPTTLSDASSAGPGDATWAWQWDFNLGIGASVFISQNNTLGPTPVCPFESQDFCQTRSPSWGTLISDRLYGVSQVDDFRPSTDSISRVCWTGCFRGDSVSGGFECFDGGSRPPQAWQVTFYEDDFGLPSAISLHDPFELVIDAEAPQGPNSGCWDQAALLAVGGIPEPLVVVPGNCYWMKLDGLGEQQEQGLCWVGVQSSNDGNNLRLRDTDGVFTIEDQKTRDITFCLSSGLDGATSPPTSQDGGCGDRSVACCQAGGGCADTTYSACVGTPEALNDAWALVSQTCAGATCPAPANDDCADAALVCGSAFAAPVPEVQRGQCQGNPLAAPPVPGELCDPTANGGQGDCFDGGPCTPVPSGKLAFRCRVPVTNVLASKDTPATGPCPGGAMNSDVWYELHAPCTGQLTVRTCHAAGFDGMMAVYGFPEGSPDPCPIAGNADLLECNDDFCPGFATTEGISTNVLRGDLLKIAVGGWAPTNDDASAGRGATEMDIGFICDVPSRLYVNAATGEVGNGGTSWSDSFLNLQDALDAAVAAAGAVEEVWVAKGTYKPDERGGVSSGLNTDTFELINGVTIYGGFEGTEVAPLQRDIAANETILSGDLLGDDTGPLDDVSRDENSQHVLTGTGTDLSAVLDGVTVTAGGDPLLPGGGIYLLNAGASIRNCTIRENQGADGGGIYVTIGATLIENCTFTGNAASVFGGSGGALASNASPITIDGCDFTTNTAIISGGAVALIGGGTTVRVLRSSFVGNSVAANGGAMHLADNMAILLNCSIRSNIASFNGGGILFAGSAGTAEVTNCEFVNNAATGGSGGAVADNSNVLATTYTNCTITDNTATVNGGGIWNETGVSGTLANSVVWNNEDFGGIDESSQIHDTDSPSTVNYSCIQGLTGALGGVGNIDVDPLFVDVPGQELRLTDSSPCIDAGDNTAVPTDSEDIDGDLDTGEPLPIDLLGLPRFIEDRLTADTGVGSSPFVDMGAHEFARDCNNNDVPDDLDLTSCAGDPACADCQPNQIPDICDIASSAGDPALDDCNLNGVPDGCENPLPNCADNGGSDGDWTSNIWGLQGIGDYPDNLNGAANVFVTVKDATVTLNTDVVIPALRINNATLKFTEGDLLEVINPGEIQIGGVSSAPSTAGRANAGDISDSVMLVGAGDTLEGTNLEVNSGGALLVEGDAVIDLSGKLTIHPEAHYQAADLKASLTAALSVADLDILGGSCAASPATDGGSVILTDAMTLVVSNDLLMKGSLEASCGAAARAVRGGITPPPKLATAHVVTIGNNLILVGIVDIAFGGTAARGTGTPEIKLGGSLINQSTAPCLVDLEQTQITLNGSEVQTFEAGSQDFGPTPDAYARPTDCPTFPVPGRTLIDKSFAVGTIKVLGGREVTFQDEFDNDGRGQAEPEAVYVHTLILEANSTVNLDRVRLYYDTLTGDPAAITLTRGGIHQAVEFAEIPATAPSPHDILKNRFLSFDPNNELPVMLRVELLDFACSVTAKKCSFDTDCKACTGGANAGQGCAFGADCPEGSCDPTVETCEQQSPPVLLGWLSDPGQAGGDALPGTFTSDVVATQPAARTWTESVIHIGACEIAPVQTYAISATADGVVFSDPLVVTTIEKPEGKFWGDIVGNFDGVVWSAPNGLVGVDDVNAMIKFLGLKLAPHITVVDLVGSAPTFVNFDANATDLQMVLEAFGGGTWPPLSVTGVGYPADGDVTQCP